MIYLATTSANLQLMVTQTMCRKSNMKQFAGSKGCSTNALSIDPQKLVCVKLQLDSPANLLLFVPSLKIANLNRF